MNTIQNFNRVVFHTNDAIPFQQKNSPVDKKIAEPTSQDKDKLSTATNVTNIQNFKKNEAIIAKYGSNILRTREPISTNSEAELNFKANDKPATQTAPVNPKLKPTNSKIMEFTTKNGENFKAREVQLETGEVCMAVSNEKNLNQAILMNKETFLVFMKENIAQSIQPNFKKKELSRAKGEFADKNFEIICDAGLKNRTLLGTVDNLNFNITHNGKFFKADTMTGGIGEKALNLKIKEGLFNKTITGALGAEPVDLKVSDTFTGYRIKGLFKNKLIDIKLHSKLIGYSLESDNMSLKIKNKNLFGNDLKVKGFYNEDPELIPILMDMIYCLNLEELVDISLIATY